MLLKIERISWLQGSRVQAFSRPGSKRTVVQSPESKRLVVQSPRVQSSRVQESCRPESKSPDQTLRVQFFWYALLNIVIQTSTLFIVSGFVTMFYNNVETFMFIHSYNYLVN